MIQHILRNQAPPETTSGDPAWVSVRIMEAADADGPWIELETQVLNPADPTPETPTFYTLVFLGNLAAGFYNLTWVNEDGDESPPSGSMLDNNSIMMPTTRNVAAYIPTRPKTPGGSLLLDFTSDTYPQREHVEDRIRAATNWIYAKTGMISDPALALSACHLIAIYAAMLTELGFYPEQISNDKSPYKELKKLYDEGVKALIEAVGGDGESATDDTMTISALMPHYAFPETSVGDGMMP